MTDTADIAGSTARVNRLLFQNLMRMVGDQEPGEVSRILAGLSVEEIAGLSDEAAALKERMTRAADALHGECDRRFASKAEAARIAEHKDAGTVHLEVDGYDVAATAAKKVDWAQEKLAELWEKIAEAKDDPAQYMRIEYKVSEKAFSAWPEWLQAQFLPARTVRVGRASYEFKKVK